MLANKTENSRLERVQRLIDKERRFKSNLQNKIIQRTSKLLTEKRAMLQLLANDYKFDNFVTMKEDFDATLIDNKETARHYVIESRVFNSGFNMNSMKPEILRKIRKMDPHHKYKLFKRRLLDNMKEQNVEINREISRSAFYKMLHDREHWRDYNFPPTHERWSNSRLPQIAPTANKGIPKQYIERVENSISGDSNACDAERTDTEVDKPKEQSKLLERRIARPKHDTLSMTMRTLGPVYFQTTVGAETTETL